MTHLNFYDHEYNPTKGDLVKLAGSSEDRYEVIQIIDGGDAIIVREIGGDTLRSADGRPIKIYTCEVTDCLTSKQKGGCPY